MASGVPSYGVETYVDNWMNYFERPNDIFQGGHDFSRNFVSSDATGFPIASSPQFYPPVTSTAAIPPIPLDPNLVDGHNTPYDSQSTQPGAALNGFRPDLLGSNEDEIRSTIAEMDPKMMATLENFARLSARQQEQFLELIRKKRGQPESSNIGGSMDMRFMGYHVMSAPSGKVNPFPRPTGESETHAESRKWRGLVVLRLNTNICG